MKRVMLCLLAMLTALTLTLPGLAEEALTFSPAAEAMRTGDRALQEKYGLSRSSLGLFNREVALYGDCAIVTYTAAGGVHEALAGQYAVVITPEGVSAYWTHDGVDEALWQSGDLASPAWGQPQLQAYLQAGPGGRYGFCDPYLPQAVQLADNAADKAMRWMGEYVQPLQGNDPKGEMEAQKRAAAVLQQCYGVTLEEQAQAVMQQCTLFLRPDGSTFWQLVYYMRTDEEYSFFVSVDASTFEILNLDVSTGGLG